jgi:hypothetical protein
MKTLEHIIRDIHERKTFIKPETKTNKGEWEGHSEKEREKVAKNLAKDTAPPASKVQEDIVDEAIGIGGSDKPVGTQFAQVKFHIAPPGNTKGKNKAANNIASDRVDAKEKLASPIKMEAKVPNQGTAPTVAALSGNVDGMEDGKKKIKKEEAEGEVSKGTEARRKVQYVGRLMNVKPTDIKSKLGRQAAYKKNVIDEEIQKKIKTIRKTMAANVKDNAGANDAGIKKKTKTDNDLLNSKKKVVGNVIWNPDLDHTQDDSTSI